MEIRESARRHGVPDADMLHVVRRPIKIVDLDESKTFFIGADGTGRLLEVIVVDLDTEEERIIHAMHLRGINYRFL